MRRSEKEIKDKDAIESIVRRSAVCRLGLSDGDQPYVVPLCFGYANDVIYFHGAPDGKKIDIIRRNQKVCVEFEVNAEILRADDACHWGLRYQSVIGYGKASFVDDPEEKIMALEIIMGQYSDEDFTFSQDSTEGTLVIKVDIESMTGKQSA